MPKRLYFPLLLILSIFLGLGCSAALTLPEPVAVTAAADRAALPAKVADGTILHAYMWKFSAIQAALPTIASSGYKAVQVSPIQGTKATGAWYLLYQPINLAIGNGYVGTEAEFKSLCTAANGYGIKIIVDAVLNQVADNGTDGGFDPAVDATIKSHPEWFHNLGTIGDYTNRYQVTQKNLGNGPDWNTQRADVQQQMLNFLNLCIADGAGGFRFDAAKHIETNAGEDAGQTWAGSFWGTITGGLSNAANLYLYGEVLPDKGDNDQGYTNYFDITTHGYLWTVANGLDAQNLTGVGTVTHYDHAVDPYKALVYAENHDTFEHGETTNFSYNKRLLSYAIMIARAGMTPLVLDRPADDIWKDNTIVALNNFRNAMVGQDEYLRSPSTPVLLIERGTLGAVLVNAGAGAASVSTATNLAAGTYTNRAPAGGTYTVSGGVLTGTLAAGSVAVLYNLGSSAPGTPTGLTGSATGSSSITLTWAAPSGATSYTVYRSTSAASGFAAIGTTDTNTYADNGLSANTTYYYYVTATNSFGTSGNSATISVATQVAGTGVKVHLKNNSVLNWTTFNCYYWASNGSPAANAWPGQAMLSEGNSWYGFTIPASSSASIIFNNGTTQTIDLTRTSEGWFVPTGLTAGKVTGTWYASNPDTVPAAPAGVSAASVSASSISVSWSASANATTYTVYKSTSATTGFAAAGSTAGTTLTLTGLAAGTTYYLYVTAGNSVGTSPASATVSAATGTSTSVTTTLKVHYNAGTGNTLAVRGSLSPLSWTAGKAATWTTGNVWVYTTTAIASGAAFEFKALINDTMWSDGANYDATGGSTVDIYPTFNGNFYDVMDAIGTNWSVTGGVAGGTWHQGSLGGSGVAEVYGATTESQLTLKNGLSKLGTVTLAFKYSLSGLTTGDYLAVDVLKGTTWTQVASLTGTIGVTNVSYNISTYASTSMKIRFRALMTSSAKKATVDNVTISVK